MSRDQQREQKHRRIDLVSPLTAVQPFAVAYINYAERIIDCKVVYYGPESSGKSCNLLYIYERTRSSDGGMQQVPSQSSDGVTYDYLPLSLGEIRGFQTRFHLFTVPGHASCTSARLLLLKGLDGVIFVADSQEQRMAANAESAAELSEFLKQHGYALEKLPFVVQYNKRDLPNAASRESMDEALRLGAPIYEAIATKGVGVFDALKDISKLVLTELKKGS